MRGIEEKRETLRESIILLNKVVAVQTVRDHFADEAWAAPNPFHIRIKIERFSIVHGLAAPLETPFNDTV